MTSDEVIKFVSEFKDINAKVYNEKLTQFSIDFFEEFDSDFVYPLESCWSEEDYFNNGGHTLYHAGYRVNTLLEVLDKSKRDYEVIVELKNLIDKYDTETK